MHHHVQLNLVKFTLLTLAYSVFYSWSWTLYICTSFVLLFSLMIPFMLIPSFINNNTRIWVFLIHIFPALSIQILIIFPFSQLIAQFSLLFTIHVPFSPMYFQFNSHIIYIFSLFAICIFSLSSCRLYSQLFIYSLPLFHYILPLWSVVMYSLNLLRILFSFPLPFYFMVSWLCSSLD